MEFLPFFQSAFQSTATPFPYQQRLAEAPWPDAMSVPTGLGKTAASILAWAYKRANGDADTPRRLVYCLPMRVLVEQTAGVAALCFDHLRKAGMIRTAPGIHVLMGGDLDNDWDIDPETDALIVGTQDQLLSRALNRGYGLSRFRWPIHFALLNNDCLWVLDEVQLMGVGLTTSVQLQAFRESLGTLLPARSLWMSATLDKEWLKTTDFVHRAAKLSCLELAEEDRRTEQVAQRFNAVKPIDEAPTNPSDTQALAKFILKAHRPGTRTLVIKNTVRHAQELFERLSQSKTDVDLVLLHSRFRPGDRANALERLLATPSKQGTICVSTQVVEAGVDVSSNTLISDVAPWASMVQRFGRCNRDGALRDARVYWVRPDLANRKAVAPYEREDLQNSASMLEGMTDVGPQSLPHFTAGAVAGQTIRRKDLVDLFDTTPDLAGSDIDVSRFIREASDLDLQVFWRRISEKASLTDQATPSREELCSVPVAELSVLAKNGLDCWSWDHLEAAWHKPSNLHPGMTVMLSTDHGGYSSSLGWTGNRKDIPEEFQSRGTEPQSDEEDYCAVTEWQSLSSHTDEVVAKLRHVLSILGLSDSRWSQPLIDAARWHDAGKAHPVFQEAITKGKEPPDQNLIWAKGGVGRIAYSRKGFRHELASALAMLNMGLTDLAAYLAASHHGKVRVSIRSLPHEEWPENPDVRFARGIWDGDQLLAADLGAGTLLPRVNIDLSCMEMGRSEKGDSWVGKVLALRDDPGLGPLRLAMLEALLRVADWRASRKDG